jgi:hypothetical protein
MCAVDTDGFQPVVMVSEDLAREMWGTPSTAIGKHLREFPMMPWHEVIGVIQNVREKGVQETAPEIVYWAPLMENAFGRPCAGAKDSDICDPQRACRH